MVPKRELDLQRELAEKEVLLSLNMDIASIRNKEDLRRVLQIKLKKYLAVSGFRISLIDAAASLVLPFLLIVGEYGHKNPQLEPALTSHLPLQDGLFDKVLETDAPVITDLAEKISTGNAPKYIHLLQAAGLTEIVSVPLKSGHETIGVMCMIANVKNALQPFYFTLIENIAAQISIAIANILANETLIRREKEKELLLSLSNAITSTRDKTDLLKIITHQLKQLFNYNDASIIILDKAQKTYSAYLLDMEDKRTSHPDCLPNVTGNYAIADGICDVILQADGPVIFDNEQTIKQGPVPSWLAFLYKTGIVEMVSVALRFGDKNIGAFLLHSEKRQYFQPYQFSLIQGISYQLSIAVANILANEEIARQLEEIKHYKSQLEEQNQYLQEQVEKTYNHDEIIGTSYEMQKVFHMLSQVSFTNSTVLVLGETGTGKELIARAIHNASSRKEKLMVKVNCAALPASLIESELFGHEKGSFTGATERRIGKFELAHKGTLFLDEIGEMPLDLQVKLLRALQEKEIERVGGQTTIKTDVRLIAATNRDLQKEVAAGRFRSDLFYRLHVFPVVMPPLRERKEDIPLLVTHFIAKYARRTGKKTSAITKSVMKELMAYSWPGNVRELEHFIERNVLLATGNTIKQIDLPSPAGNRILTGRVEDHPMKTLEENERDYILAVLRNCKGKVFGPGGAAEILNIHVSTLNSRMKKLGIKKEHIFAQKK